MGKQDVIQASEKLSVTRPFLPPLDEYTKVLEGIWDRRRLTNQGPVTKDLEFQLKEYLRLDGNVVCAANAGLLLQMVLKALGVTGEVIVTPFTYVATASCPIWERCKVVFADIEEDFLTLDPASVESHITPNTEAIIATHVFGNSCNVDAFDRIEEKYGIPVIYDAAHCFGGRYQGRSLIGHGRASVLSLHATKLFHSVEGGILHSSDEELFTKVEWMRRYAHDGPERYFGVGINAKMSEIHAAMGICNLPYMKEVLTKRLQLVSAYNERLASHSRVRFAFQIRPGTEWNGAYYAVRFESEKELLATRQHLDQRGIGTRRYFWPSLNNLSEFGAPFRLATVDDLAPRILVLPLFHEMGEQDVDRVVDGL